MQGMSLNYWNQMFPTATPLSMQIYSLNNLIVPMIDKPAALLQGNVYGAGLIML